MIEMMPLFTAILYYFTQVLFGNEILQRGSGLGECELLFVVVLLQSTCRGGERSHKCHNSEFEKQVR